VPFPIEPPIEPMLARIAESLPADGTVLYEPKWDGFRAIAFRGGADVYIQSRDLRPLDRYFPELHEVFATALPDGCVVDGEIVIATPRGLDFDSLQMRLHPAASRVAKLARETPASFVAFDLLAVAGRDLRGVAQAERRTRLEQLLAGAQPPVHLTPMTRDPALATEWLARFEGAGLDGVMAKPERGLYTPGKRTMVKVKHVRSADCVVAGFRWHAKGPNELVGSLLLGLYDAGGVLQHVGVTSAFTMAVRKQLAAELEPLRAHALDDHPWRAWASAGNGSTRMPRAAPAAARRAASGSAAARGRRPARRFFLPRRQLEQRLERGRGIVDARVPVADVGEARRHRREGEVPRIAALDLLPRERGGNARVGLRTHRVGGGDGPVLRVLVVVEEDAVPLFLPPLAGGERFGARRSTSRASASAARRTSSNPQRRSIRT
jgi:hypothetical protein